MAWVVHSKWLERQFDGTDALDLDNVIGGSTIKLGIVTEGATPIDADTISLISSLTLVDSTGTYPGPETMTGMTAALSAGDLVFDTNDPTVIAQDAGAGFTDGRSLVIWDDTNSHIIAHHTEAGIFGNTTGSVTIILDVNGIWKMTI